jgi:signal transduction histidine kinase
VAWNSARLRPILQTVGLLYGLLFGLSAVLPINQRFGWWGAIGALALTLLATAAYGTVILHNRNPIAQLLVIALAAGGVNLLGPYCGLGFAFALVCVTPFTVRIPAVIAVSLVDAVVTMASLAGIDANPGSLFGTTVGVLFTAAFATAIQQLVLARQQTSIAARASASEAVLAERQRLAREMHDLLAHTLSAQIVHLEGARLLMARGDRPEQALHQVTRAVRLARDGLDETKRALEALRGDDLRVTDRLKLLAGEFRTLDSGRLLLDVPSEPEALAVESRWAIVRTAQEALTNVRKHASGAAVAIRLSRVDDWYELEVTDSGGQPGALGDSGAGFGLTGMRERAELIGGSLRAGRSGDGFQVLLRVPR